MNIKEASQLMKKIQSNLLEFLDKEDNVEENFQNLIEIFNDQDIKDKKYLLNSLIELITKIGNNHNRVSNFFGKLERIIRFFKDDIQKHYSNTYIFNVFKKNKRLLLFLLDEKIIKMDKDIATIMTTTYKKWDYHKYFFNEIRPFITTKTAEQKAEENFDENRKIGENDDYICKLIQKDLIEEFIIYINKSNYSLKSSIKQSIYETNSFLLKKQKISLIEYAAFFGSVQIFKYLYKNGVKLTPSLWIYSVHGENPEILNLLEENNIESLINTFEALEESIKCHHNDFAYYIQDHFFKNDIDSHKLFKLGLKYHNHAFIDDVFISTKTLYELCQYDHQLFIEILLKSPYIEEKKILWLNFSIQFQINFFYVDAIS